MHHDFWHQRWQTQQIGFHLNEVNPFLLAHAHALGLQPGQRIFVPLCGKTLDIHWLLAQGFAVVGVELSTLAVEALFAALALTPEIVQAGTLTRYRTPHLEVFQGDFFALDASQLGAVHAIYDRAALIALPADMREQYRQHLIDITRAAPQLLISLAYDQSLAAGPPFSVSKQAVRAYYAADYMLTELASMTQAKGFKGQYPAEETAWLLASKPAC